MTGKSQAAAQNVGNQLPVNNLAVNGPVLPCQANRDPQLKVKVYANVKDKKQYVQAHVTASALTHASVAVTGVADFSYVLPGTYQVSVAVGDILAPDDEKFYSEGTQQTVTLARGDKKTLELEVKPKNIVTPKIDVEYKVVVFDKKLAQFQTANGEAAEDLLRPGPTRIEVWMECSETDPAYNGDGTLAIPNCGVFLDEACAQPLGARKLTHAELTAGEHLKLYLRGTARGTFTATLTLDVDLDTHIKVEDPATVDMGVVQLDLEVYEHATPVNVAATTYALTGHCTDLENANLIPDQVILSDDDKVRKSRLLHRQKDKHHGRAKVIMKLTAAEWPAGTDGYLIVLDHKPSDLRAYDAEKDGNRQALPYKPTVADLKAGDKTLWIEGAHSSTRRGEARLFLTLDRDSGGLSKTKKENADFARFTVVKIDSLKLEYTAPGAGAPKPWNASKKRWYINYQAGDLGRTVKIRAKLSKPIQNVAIYFMLCPDKDNMKEKNWGIDLPGSWSWNGITVDVKQKDKVNATDLLHKTVDTDAEGQADCDLVLSQFGGDVFWPAAYVRQDPHLAAYVRGHATLEEREPKIAADPIKVWRKFAYQKIKVSGRKYPSTNAAEDVYGKVRAEMLKRPSHTFTKDQVLAMPNPSYLPEYMFKVGGGKERRLNVSDANRGQFFVGAAAEGEHPIKVPIVTCDYNWGLERNSGVVSDFELPPTAFPHNVLTDVLVCKPPLQGGTLLATGDWYAAEWDPTANGGAGAWINVRNGLLADGDLDIDRRRTTINTVRVNLPARVGETTAATRVWIRNLSVQGAEGHFLGGYSPATQRIVCVYDPANSGDYQNTVVHELGHAFRQTADGWTVPKGAKAPAAGIPVNPNFIDDLNGGPHCTFNTNKCVMFTFGPIAGSLNKYCDDCHPHLLVQDMTTLW